MENRFGIKDFFLFGLLIVIIGLIVTCMIQYDRQWGEIAKVKDETINLKNDLNLIRRLVSDGVQFAPATQTSSGQPATNRPDPFAALKAAEQMPGFARGDWLVENLGSQVGKITPFVGSDIYSAIVQARVLEPLVQRDPNTLEYAPLLARDWSISEDGLTMTFDLRRGVVFSDGIPLTAADVVFTFDFIRNEKINAQRERSYMDHIESVTAEGDYRVVFKFKKFIYNSFSTVSGTGIMPRHFYGQFIEKPNDFNENPGLLIGTGPFRMATPDGWRPGQRIELLRNERYWGTAPAFDRLVFLEVKDDIVEETLFRNREIDRLGPQPEQYRKLKDDPEFMKRAQNYEYYNPLGGYSYIGWNQRTKINDQFRPTKFADKRVRQAMTLLIDRESLAQNLYYGLASPATGPFGYGTLQNEASLKPYPFDVERARALLAEAGYKDRNNDGVIEGEDGKPFEFKLSYGSGNPLTDRIVLYIKDSFARLGVKVELDAVEFSILITRLDNRDFEACVLGWSTSLETDCNQIFHSSQMANNGNNFVSYVNPELDAAIDAARATVDEEARMLAWRKVHRIIYEDQPYTFMLNRMSLQFVDRRIHNVEKSKLGLNYAWTETSPYPWFVPAGEQLRKTAN